MVSECEYFSVMQFLGLKALLCKANETMHILICSATTFELSPFIDALEKTAPLTPYKLDIFITGAGIPLSILKLTHHISIKRPDLILQVGIAGSLNSQLKMNEVVWVNKDRFFEMGMEDRDRVISLNSASWFEMAELFNSDGSLDASQLPPWLATENLKHVEGFTVLKGHGAAASIAAAQKRYPHVWIETMEGASAFLCGKYFGIDTLQLRAISNRVETRNVSEWHINSAVEMLNNCLKRWFLTPY
jgi:futalosine hydrolase